MKSLSICCGVILMSVIAAAANLPSPTVPDGLGTNIHFTGAPARDLDMLQAGGFKFIRMDFHWATVEKQKGVYNFKPYDELTDGLEQHGIRPLYILDYSNKLYEEDNSVRTEEGREVFANFAAAAAARYKGRGVIWELWNEPNGGFWLPKPGVDDYMKLAHAVFPAIRKADPNSTCVAPGTSGIPMDFLETCFKQGLLQMVDAVSVHPYRQSNPETVVADIQRLRALIARYSPNRPDLPVISSEWGYSVSWGGFSDAKQGEYLPRELLTNLSLGLPVSIYYDWHDDGTDAKNAEHNFGTVTHSYQPKPAYLAMQRLVAALKGMQFVKRLQSAPEDWLLLFSNGKNSTVAAWTTGDSHSAAPIPGHEVQLTGAPQYLPVPADATSLLAQGTWTVAEKSVGVRGGAVSGGPLTPQFSVHVHNPFDHALNAQFEISAPAGVTGKFDASTRLDLAPGTTKTLTWTGTVPRRASDEVKLTVTGTIDGSSSQQPVTFLLTNALSLNIQPALHGGLAAVLHNPSGDSFRGALQVSVGRQRSTYAIDFDPGRKQISVHPEEREKGAAPSAKILDTDALIDLPKATAAAGQDVRVVLREGGTVVADSGAVRFAPLQVTTETAKAFNDGDSKVLAKFALTDTAFTGPAAPAAKGLHFTYEYGTGWKFVRIAPPKESPIDGKPQAIGVWVRGEKTGCSLRMRFTDSNGRTFQPEFGRLDFDGWRFLSAPLTDPHVGHWGGSGDESKIAYPIRINSFILVDGKKTPLQGSVDFAGFCLQYGE